MWKREVWENAPGFIQIMEITYWVWQMCFFFTWYQFSSSCPPRCIMHNTLTWVILPCKCFVFQVPESPGSGSGSRHSPTELRAGFWSRHRYPTLISAYDTVLLLRESAVFETEILEVCILGPNVLWWEPCEWNYHLCTCICASGSVLSRPIM